MNQRKAGTLLVYLKTALSVAISFIYTPFLLQMLGQSQYGSLHIASSIISYLNLIGLGVSASYIRFNMRCRKEGDKAKEASLNGSYMILFSIMGVLALVAGSILTANAELFLGAKITPEEYSTVKTLMAICVVNMAFSFPGSLFRMMLNSYERFTFIHIIELAASVLQPGICFVLLLAGYKAVPLQITAVALNLGQIVANAIYAFRILRLKFSFRNIRAAYFKEIFVFSAFIFLNQIVNTINWNVDNYLTALFVGTAGTAIYAFGYQFVNYFMLLSTAISNVFAPLMNKLVLKDDRANINECFARIGRLQFILLSFVFSIFAVVGQDFVQVFTGGTEYSDSFWVALVLMATTIIPLSQNLGIEIQRAMNRHKFRSVLYFGIAILNLGISIPLCKQFGALGCAIGTAIGQVLGNTIIINIYYKKVIKIDLKTYFVGISKTLPALGGAFILCYAARYYLAPNFITAPLGKVGFLVEGVACVVVFGAALWFFCLNRYEKGLITKPLLAVFKRRGKEA